MVGMSDIPAPDSALILHGWKNRRPADHWQHHLADDLAAAGAQVEYPQFPDPDEPRLERWFETLAEAYGRLAGERRVIVTHSLGGYLLWNALAGYHTERVGPIDVHAHRIFFVAPPSPQQVAGQPVIAPFGNHGVTRALVEAASAQPPIVVASDNDEWTTADDAHATAERIGGRAVIVPGQRHFSLEDGYGRWDSFTRFVLSDGASELSRRAD